MQIFSLLGQWSTWESKSWGLNRVRVCGSLKQLHLFPGSCGLCSHVVLRKEWLLQRAETHGTFTFIHPPKHLSVIISETHSHWILSSQDQKVPATANFLSNFKSTIKEMFLVQHSVRGPWSSWRSLFPWRRLITILGNTISATLSEFSYISDNWN